MRRVAILVDEKDRRLGRAVVAESTMIISHKESLFIRSGLMVKISANGLAAEFRYIEPAVRDRLDPA